MKAQQHIKDYLNREGRKKSWLAKQVAVRAETVSRWMTGKLIPTPQARIILSGIVGQDLTQAEDWEK